MNREYPQTSGNFERRYVAGELRATPADGDAMRIEGHAARFGVLSADLGGFREKINPGAFAKSLLTSDIRALWNHDPIFVLGRNTSGTLALSEDVLGLRFSCELPATNMIREMVAVPIQRGDVSQCSFGFRTIEDFWEETTGGWIRTLLEVSLFDVSPVTFPAYAETDVAVRSLQNHRMKYAPVDWLAGLRKRRLDIALLS